MERVEKADVFEVCSSVDGMGVHEQENGVGTSAQAREANHSLHDPCKGYFMISFALGEKAVKAAHESDLPVSVLKVIDNARKYAEGRGVRLQVRSVEDVRNVEKIATIKMAS